MSCSGGKAWYVCSKGPFQGCCSTDPCNSGICPDDDNNSNDSADTAPVASAAAPAAPSSVSVDSTTSTKATKSSTTSHSASTATTTSTAATKSISTSTSADLASTSLSSNSLSAKDSPSTAQTRTTLSTALPTSSAASSSGNKPNAGLIGGVVAGTAAALILLCLLFCLIRRSRKKRGKSFTLLYWRGPMYPNNEKSPSPTRSTLRNLLTSGDSHSYDSDSSPSQPRAAASRKSSTTGPGTGTLVSTPSHTLSHSISSTPSFTLTPPSSITFSTPSSTLLADPTTSAAAAAAIAISSNTGPGTSTSTGPSTRSTSHRRSSLPQQQQLEPTPELSDTGFYRQRAELAAHSARELINVPLSQRQRPRHHRPSPRQPEASSALSPSLRPPPARPIVTADGVVLAPNLDTLVKDNNNISNNGNDPGSGEDHVMSFMRYDAAKDAELPAYRASWRRSSTGSANVTMNECVRSWGEKGKERRGSQC